jgi:hypothetical protein
VDFMECNVWSSCAVVVSMCVCALKSFTGWFLGPYRGLSICLRYVFGGGRVVVCT